MFLWVIFFKYEIAFIYIFFYHISLHNQGLQEPIQQALRWIVLRTYLSNILTKIYNHRLTVV